MCQRGTSHLATLKSKKLIAFLKTLQGLKQEWKVQPRDQANRRRKIGLVWRNRTKICQIINAYLYLPFFLLFILWGGGWVAHIIIICPHPLLVEEAESFI
jgi:hypothetical protein